MSVALFPSLTIFGLGLTWDRPRKRLHLVFPFLAVLVEGERALPDGVDLNLTGMHMTPNEFCASVEGGACAAIAAGFAEELDRVGAQNYVTVEFHHHKHGPIQVTVQRKRGKTPSDVATDLRREVTELRAKLKEPRQ